MADAQQDICHCCRYILHRAQLSLLEKLAQAENWPTDGNLCALDGTGRSIGRPVRRPIHPSRKESLLCFTPCIGCYGLLASISTTAGVTANDRDDCFETRTSHSLLSSAPEFSGTDNLKLELGSFLQ